LKSLPDADEQKFTAPDFWPLLAGLLEIVSGMAEPPQARAAFLEALAVELARYPAEAREARATGAGVVRVVWNARASP
jgi:hypothetical protein